MYRTLAAGNISLTNDRPPRELALWQYVDGDDIARCVSCAETLDAISYYCWTCGGGTHRTICIKLDLTAGAVVASTVWQCTDCLDGEL